MAAFAANVSLKSVKSCIIMGLSQAKLEQPHKCIYINRIVKRVLKNNHKVLIF
jgi:hypothetical protein